MNDNQATTHRNRKVRWERMDLETHRSLSVVGGNRIDLMGRGHKNQKLGGE